MITALALRFCAARALKGATLANSRVYDSAISSIDDMVERDTQPFIVVSTDDQTYNIVGFDIIGGGGRQIDLVIDIAVASAVFRQVEGGEEVEIVVPHTDAGTELTVNLISRQVLRALFEPQSGGVWGKMFRQIALSSSRVMIRRGAGTQKGVKFAAAQLVITVKPIAEPQFGFAPDFVWADFIAEMRKDVSLAKLADEIETVIIGDQIPEWKAISSIIGFDAEVATGIGIYPLAGEESEPVTEETVMPDGWSLNENSGRVNDPTGDWPDSDDRFVDETGVFLVDDMGKKLTDGDDDD